MNINFVNQGGWHFTNIKTPKEIHYKLSNFLHHLEYEHSGLKESDLETIIKEKEFIMIMKLINQLKSGSLP